MLLHVTQSIHAKKQKNCKNQVLKQYFIILMDLMKLSSYFYAFVLLLLFCEEREAIQVTRYYYIIVHQVIMKNKKTQVKSSEKDSWVEGKTKQKIKTKKVQHSVSVVYESSRSREIKYTSSQGGGASPKPNKTMEKYNKYIQFITNNKINSNSLHVSKDELVTFKKNGVDNDVPIKNSPVPYSKGRKSGFSKLSQPVSPNSKQFLQRNSFPKTIAHSSLKQNNPNFYFVKGNNANNKEKRHVKKISNQIQNKQKSLSRGDESCPNEPELKKNKNGMMNTNGQKKQSILRGENKKQYNRMTYRQSMVDAKNEKSDKQQQKLCQQLFKGIQFYRDLGKGAHALVRSAVDWNHKRKIAVKIYDKVQLSEKQLKSIEREVQILMGLNHPNIIKLYQIIQTYKTVQTISIQINLIMEYGGGNSLEQFIKSKPEGYLNQKQTKLIFRQVLDAVRYLHENNITHRDIKSENILLNKHLNLKIIDFGFSLIGNAGFLFVVDQNNKNINTYYGTPTYMAPQMVSKVPHNPQLADRWSLGVLLFVMLNGHCPFRASTQKQLFSKINKGQYQYTRTVHPLARDLISKFMVKTPHERLSAKSALEHTWLQSE